eukprot:Anaeramoba_ignava/a90970_47.p1 GENE.a90970_47~~a90970_47.p1  ORF type:complete len:1076 (+),score=217.16 a90970_47:524-3751(+)
MDTNGSIDSGCGDLANPCKELSQAVINAQINGTIIMNPGNYSVNFYGTTINKSVTIVGQDKSQVFVDCDYNKYGLIVTNTQNIAFENISFANCEISGGSYGGAALTINSQAVSIKNCQFINNNVEPYVTMQGVYSAAIFFDNCQTASVENCLFKNNLNSHNGSGAIFARYFATADAVLKVNNNSFVGNQGAVGALQVNYTKTVQNSSIQIAFSNFTSNLGANISGAVFIQYTADGAGNSIYINNTNFTNNSALIFGAFGLFHNGKCQNSTFSISKSFFKGNKANIYSGAISQIYNSLFNTSYIEITSSNFTSNTGYRGAIYIDDSPYGNHGDILNNSLIIQGCLFTSNTGESGGAISANSRVSLNMLKNTYSNNSAHQGGAMYLKNILSFYDGSSNYLDDTAIVGAEFMCLTSGQFEFKSVEFQSKLVEDTIFFVFSNHSLDLSYSTFECPEGSVFIIENETDHNFDLEYKYQFSFECVECPVGTYSLRRGGYNTDFDCYLCPTQAECRGGADVYVKNGFWGDKLESGKIQFFPCPEDFCSPNSINNAQLVLYNTCKNHREGFLCTQCTEGYTESLFPSGECKEKEKCHHQIFQYLLMLFFISIWLVWSLIFIPQAKTGHFHIMAYFFQTLSIVIPMMDSRKSDGFWRFLLSIAELFNLQTYLPLFGSFGECPGAEMNSVQKKLMRLVGPSVSIGILLFVYIFHLIRSAKSSVREADESDEDDSKKENSKNNKKNDDEINLSDQSGDLSSDEVSKKKNLSKSKSQSQKMGSSDQSLDFKDADWHHAEINFNDDTDNSDTLSSISYDKTVSELSDSNIDRIDKAHLESLVGNLITRPESESLTRFSWFKRANIALITILFLFYFVALKIVLETTNCIQISRNSEKKRYLYIYTTAECYTGAQKFGIFMAIILSILPLILLFFLIKKRTIKNPDSLLSIFTGPYKRAYYWFSVMMFYWRFLLLIFFVFVKDPTSQSFVLMFFCIIFLILHLNFLPFASNWHNSLQTISLSILVLVSTLNISHSSWEYAGLVTFSGSLKKLSFGMYYFIFSLCTVLFVYSFIIYVNLLKRHFKCFKCK